MILHGLHVTGGKQHNSAHYDLVCIVPFEREVIHALASLVRNLANSGKILHLTKRYMSFMLALTRTYPYCIGSITLITGNPGEEVLRMRLSAISFIERRGILMPF